MQEQKSVMKTKRGHRGGKSRTGRKLAARRREAAKQELDNREAHAAAVGQELLV
jgi:hypothetical protein